MLRDMHHPRARTVAGWAVATGLVLLLIGLFIAGYVALMAGPMIDN